MAAAVALLHLAMIGWIVYSILYFQESDWPMYWMPAAWLDVPALLLWFAKFGPSLLLRSKTALRSITERPAIIVGVLRHMPIHLWLAIPPAALSLLLLLAALLGMKLGRMADFANFIAPLGIFGSFGTFIWSDLVMLPSPKTPLTPRSHS